MPELHIGAHPASTKRTQRSGPSRLLGTVTLSLIVALLAIAAAPFTAAAPRVEASGAKPKAVLIVGPTGDMTNNYLEKGRQIADQAEAAGMDVRRIFHPRATPERVLANIQGAKFVLYLGHGNGWPSPYAPFQERTKNGFGLNPYDGSSANKHVYRGANWIRKNIKLANHAVVMLVGACYSPGNAEPDMPVPSEDVARQRVDNFAAGFLHSGASVVFALGWQPKANFPQMLMTSNKTFDEMFMTPAKNRLPYGYIGWKDKYFNSQRTPGARIHLDPHQSYGYYRAATGSLDVTAAQWRGSGNTASSAPASSAPSAPTGLVAEALGYRRVKLTWEPSTSSVSGTINYRVVRNGRRIATVTSLEFTDRPYNPGSYEYKVRAVDAAGNPGEFSAVVTGQAIKGPI